MNDEPILSRQRRWQIKKVKEGKCQICGKPQMNNAFYCEKHRESEAKRKLKSYHANK